LQGVEPRDVEIVTEIGIGTGIEGEIELRMMMMVVGYASADPLAEMTLRVILT